LKQPGEDVEKWKKNVTSKRRTVVIFFAFFSFAALVANHAVFIGNSYLNKGECSVV
jgi:hypothetical protein